ncbi:hypothetical protein INT43_007575 [Umbelopsis isabellina]|uniref:BHLH domain-containing protein n=1 Tax=Mortierella isabellina TaxID=91625 RepID=A0A8H7PN07_MORIS|nr:hypothetical protein INT43_007575 [Umbelopsis isabellina]
MCPEYSAIAVQSVMSADDIMIAEKQMPSPVHSQPRSSDEYPSTEDDISEDEEDQTAIKQEGSNTPGALFLNFSSNLTEQSFGKKKQRGKRQSAYKVNGVNILNRNNLDSKTAIERIKRRRENHNYVERRRRDVINNTIMDIAETVPNAITSGQKPNKGSILRLALDYIKHLQSENQKLRHMVREENSHDGGSMCTTPPTPAASNMDHGSSDMGSYRMNQQHNFGGYASAPNSPNLARTYSPQTASSVPSSPIRHLNIKDDHTLPPLSLPPARNFVNRSMPHFQPSPVSSPQPQQTCFPAQPPQHQQHVHQQPKQPQQQPVFYHKFMPHPPLPQAPLPAPSGLRPILPMRPAPPPQRPLNYAQNRMTGLERQYGAACRY